MAHRDNAPVGRLAVDIGGTFTDVVLEQGERQWQAKVPTTPSSPEIGFLNGVDAALKVSGLTPAEIGIVIHGTTLATNAVIERKGAISALLTTEGFRDTIELGTESRFDQYDLNIRKPAPLIPRHLRLPITERVAADGTVLIALDESSVRNAAKTLRENKVESVAVCFIHGYANPAHEQRTRDILRAELPGIYVSISSEVSPEVREYERANTTCVNAYVQPLIHQYLDRLEQELARLGFVAKLFLMLSNGGLTTRRTASAFPVRLLESGPAGGAIYAQAAARSIDANRVISFDMGGTTAKVCLIDNFEPQMARQFEVDRTSRFRKGSGMPIRIPVIDMVEIGAGGGSMAHVDRLRRIHVGPESAGADPGPVAFGKGGTVPTVTDADLILGKIDVAKFAGGQMRLDEAATKAALENAATHAGLQLGSSDFAFAIAEIVDESMSNAARVHAVEIGRTLGERTMIAFGGAAPLHAARVAEKCGINTVVVPRSAGVGSAVGFLLAPVSYEVAQSRHVRLSRFQPELLNALLSSMSKDAHAVVAQASPGSRVESRIALARYIGQGHEISVNIPVKDMSTEDVAAIREAFEAAYLKLYGRLIDNIDIEILSWVVKVGVDREEQVAPKQIARAQDVTPSAWREVFDPSSGAFLRTAIFARDDLVPGARIVGPAVIAEAATSTVVTPRFDARIGADGAIIMERKAL